MSASTLFRSVTLVLIGFFAGHQSHAQDKSKEEKEKAKKRPPPVTSPIIHDDGSVTFRTEAHGAKEVFVTGEMVKGKVALELGDDKIWSVTLRDIQPGIYGYGFIVNSVKMLDGGNPALKPMRSPRTSILHLPGDHIYDFKDVPHGTVHQHGYFSKPIKRFRELKVYTPPGYETSDQDFPLLVLQHGHSDSFATWTEYGKAHWILDNLIASKRAVPMIVAMLDGHPIPESYGDGRSMENTNELETDLLQAALPMIRKLYRVKQGRQHSAIAGLSMGGLHSLSIGLAHTDDFAWIGAFSAAVPSVDDSKELLTDATDINRNLNLLWIACGKDDFLLKENKRFVADLRDADINHQWLLTKGNHSWPIWRGYLADFAPLLFR